MNSDFEPRCDGQCFLERDEVGPDVLVFQKVFGIECRCSCQHNVFLDAEGDRDDDWAFDAVACKCIVDFVPECKRVGLS